ncbi:hypothetical protein M5689_018396 [Euphorbia peplus]|nr:hypothetical protein M5689_018396 [Euphorbia peplus]
MKLASQPSQNSLNPNLIKSKFTKTFLQSLLKISKEIPAAPIFERCQKVKTAANKSLASAVGSRRAWSRAILSNISRHHTLRQHRRWHRPASLNKRRCCLRKGDRFKEAKKLRKVVPGGEAMDLYSLLDEAAHYVMCLNTQVQVMTTIADFCSSTASKKVQHTHDDSEKNFM